VPAIAKIGCRLPFAISRWWDVLFAPLCVSIGFAFYFFLESDWFIDLHDILEKKIGNSTTENFLSIMICIWFVGVIFSVFLIIISAALFFFSVLAFTFSIIIIFGLIAVLIWLIRQFIKFNKWVFGRNSD
jgi:hypothetical protein